MGLPAARAAERCRKHVAADQVGNDDRHDKMDADERGQETMIPAAKPAATECGDAARPNKAFPKILERADETLAGPKMLPQFFLQRQWFSAAK